jgi:hypothetical protein
MTKPVQQILGAMLVNDSFRADMTVPNANISAVVQSYQYGPLTGAELDVVVNIVTSFTQGKMDGSVSAVRSECPNWPCN